MAIESPVDVLRRLREQAKTQRLARAEKAEETFQRAKTGKERSRAAGTAFGEALFDRFNQPDLEQDPAVAQARQRSQWLNVAPDDVDSIRANIKSSANAGDYEVSNYLTKLYYQAQQLELKQREVAADEAPTPDKLQSKLGKQQQDVQKLRAAGRHEEADEIESRILEEQSKAESDARAKQMNTIDTMFSTGFGIDVEKDLTDQAGSQFQQITEAAMRRADAGEKLPAIRRDIQQYFEFDDSDIPFFGSNTMEFTDKAKKDLEANKIGIGRDEEGQLALYKIKDGKPVGFISWLDNSFAPEQ